MVAGRESGTLRAVSGHTLCWSPGFQGSARPHSLSKKPRHVVCQRSRFVCLFVLDLRRYLYEKSYHGINILGLCTCCRLSWNVPPKPPSCSVSAW